MRNFSLPNGIPLSPITERASEFSSSRLRSPVLHPHADFYEDNTPSADIDRVFSPLYERQSYFHEHFSPSPGSRSLSPMQDIDAYLDEDNILGPEICRFESLLPVVEDYSEAASQGSFELGSSVQYREPDFDEDVVERESYVYDTSYLVQNPDTNFDNAITPNPSSSTSSIQIITPSEVEVHYSVPSAGPTNIIHPKRSTSLSNPGNIDQSPGSLKRSPKFYGLSGLASGIGLREHAEKQKHTYSSIDVQKQPDYKILLGRPCSPTPSESIYNGPGNKYDNYIIQLPENVIESDDKFCFCDVCQGVSRFSDEIDGGDCVGLLPRTFFKEEEVSEAIESGSDLNLQDHKHHICTAGRIYIFVDYCPLSGRPVVEQHYHGAVRDIHLKSMEPVSHCKNDDGPDAERLKRFEHHYHVPQPPKSSLQNCGVSSSSYHDDLDKYGHTDEAETMPPEQQFALFADWLDNADDGSSFNTYKSRAPNVAPAAQQIAEETWSASTRKTIRHIRGTVYPIVFEDSTSQQSSTSDSVRSLRRKKAFGRVALAKMDENLSLSECYLGSEDTNKGNVAPAAMRLRNYEDVLFA